MGGFGIRVTKPEEIRPSLEKARDSGMPALVDVVIDSLGAGLAVLLIVRARREARVR